VFRGGRRRDSVRHNPSASVYLDEAPITQAGLNPDRGLSTSSGRGPERTQGTLFGDASQSGTLRIITNKADPGEMDGWLEGTWPMSSTATTRTGCVRYGQYPVIQDKLAIRLVGFESHEAGILITYW